MTTAKSFRNLLTILSLDCLVLCLQLISTVGLDDLRLHHQDQRTTVTLPTEPETQIQIRPGASFKIAMFADLHFGEATSTEWGPTQDANSIKVMSSVLDHESPGELINLCFLFFVTPFHMYVIVTSASLFFFFLFLLLNR